MTIRSVIFAGVVLACGLFESTAVAQRADAAGAVDPTVQRAVVEKAASLLRTEYIFPDVGGRAADKIESALASGAYKGLNEQALASGLTADLAAVAHDKHLRVGVAGGAATAQPSDDFPPPPPPSDAGVVRTDLLAGGVGYIELSAFPPLDLFKPSLDRAMLSLAGAKALIVDVRRNGGGDPVSVAYLVSHFIEGGKRTHINTFVKRQPNTGNFTRVDFWSSATPTASFVGKPLYVLTGRWTFSGGEEFPYDVQALKLGAVVGQTTGGGANPGGERPLGEPFFMFLPNGRAENPVTGTNWEGVGVTPDITVPEARALEVALQKLGVSEASGDIDRLSQTALFRPRTGAQPGAASAVRRMIGELATGNVRYDLLSPGLAEATRSQLPQLQSSIRALGEVTSVTFSSVNPIGLDTYDVRFEHGAATWTILLAPSGAVQIAAFNIAARTGPQR